MSCPFHTMWSSAPFDSWSHRVGTSLADSDSRSPASLPSSQSTSPSSPALSPLLFPAAPACACPTSPSLRPNEVSGSDSGSEDRRTTRIPPSRALAIDVLRSEARALLAAAERLSGPPPASTVPSGPSSTSSRASTSRNPASAVLSPGQSFDAAVKVAYETVRPRRSSDGTRLRRPKGQLVWCGVGKSGLIGRKLHATSLSLGLKSAFLHPIEALHGDLGTVDRHDAVIVLSNSGATSELLALAPHLRARGARLIALCGQPNSPLVNMSDAWIDCRLPLLHHPTPLAPPPYSSTIRGSAIESSTSESSIPGSRDSSRRAESGHRGLSSPPPTGPGPGEVFYPLDDTSSSVCSSSSSRNSANSSECSSFSLGSLADTGVLSTPATSATPIIVKPTQGSSGGKGLDSEATGAREQPPLGPCGPPGEGWGRESIEPREQEPEAWIAVPAPSSSTTLALALGDALIFSLAHQLGHGKAQFAYNHPNGELGRQLRLERDQKREQEVQQRALVVSDRKSYAVKAPLASSKAVEACDAAPVSAEPPSVVHDQKTSNGLTFASLSLLNIPVESEISRTAPKAEPTS